MIYLNMSVEEFLSKNNEFKIEEGICNHCGSSLKTTIPFIEKDYIGLVSPPCPCGKSTNEAMTMVPTSKNEMLYWNQFLV